MNDDNYDTVLEHFVNTSSFQGAQVDIKKVSGLDHLVLAKKCGILPKEAFNTFHSTTQCGVCTVMHLSLSMPFRINICHVQYIRLLHNVYSDMLFPNTVSRMMDFFDHQLGPWATVEDLAEQGTENIF